jgi:NAD-dependent dihydropyrimidine dehydrogenase PreA subunit
VAVHDASAFPLTYKERSSAESPTKLYPHFTLLKEERGTMYMVTVDKGKCDGDGTCANVCPQSVFKIEGGKAEPVNMSECINCLTCVENCPQQAITVNEI